mgnify:CR=1 FL=1
MISQGPIEVVLGVLKVSILKVSSGILLQVIGCPLFALFGIWREGGGGGCPQSGAGEGERLQVSGCP